MRHSNIRPATLTVGESVVVLSREGELIASGNLEDVAHCRFSSLSITVAGMEFSLSSYECDYAVIKAEDYELCAMPEAQGKWMEVLGRKCRHVRSELPEDVRAKALALARELEALVDPYIAQTDKGRNVDFRSFEALRGSHGLSEGECMAQMNRDLFSSLHGETASQTMRARSDLKKQEAESS